MIIILIIRILQRIKFLGPPAKQSAMAGVPSLESLLRKDVPSPVTAGNINYGKFSLEIRIFILSFL